MTAGAVPRGVLLAVVVVLGGCARGGATVTVHADSTFQTIVGWEGTTQSGEVEIPGFPRYAERLFDPVDGVRTLTPV